MGRGLLQTFWTDTKRGGGGLLQTFWTDTKRGGERAAPDFLD